MKQRTADVMMLVMGLFLAGSSVSHSDTTSFQEGVAPTGGYTMGSVYIRENEATSKKDGEDQIIGIGDAAASLIGPVYYREFVLPYERELIREIHGRGGIVKLHICGDISKLLPDIATTGADMVDIDWMVDLRRARAVLGPEVCLCGNFDPVAVLLQARPDDVRDACRRSIEQAGAPFVLSAGCEVPPDTPADNFGAMCERFLPPERNGEGMRSTSADRGRAAKNPAGGPR